jgi:nucleotide-binding universal stress UspA family protein
VGLVLVEATSSFLDEPVVTSLLARSPCDVAVLVRHDRLFAPGPVLVPFAGAEHDWTAIELAAWISRAGGTPLRLAGPSTAGGDPSRLLANASLAVQRSLGVVTEPVLVAASDEAIVREAASSNLVVVGLSRQWLRDGLGSARRALVERAEPPVLIVRHGLRPGGLAPPESRTQFTWTVRPA